MTSELSIFAARVRDFIGICAGDFSSEHHGNPDFQAHADIEFNGLALMLFTLQFGHNAAYRKICKARNISPESVSRWTEIPTVPTSAFKEFDITCLPLEQRTAVFHSSGTTAQKPSRHFHNAESLSVYETSLLAWFRPQVQPRGNLAILTPGPLQAPNSSLVHMFETIRRDFGAPDKSFLGKLDGTGGWTIDFKAAAQTLESACNHGERITVFGTAFSFVHLLDYLTEKELRFDLPPGSRIMETGGYKNRSRSLTKDELHSLMTGLLGVPSSDILCEYGMSELSSQAYNVASSAQRTAAPCQRRFQFPPWARAQVVSPETGSEVNEGETGLLRIYDLANVFSALAIQTEDLAIRRSGGFELLGRAELAEPRGCSLMTTDSK
ncbi:MAG TPA: long-chain fatty acid--CoA ligase [Verrucomicrobiae bacterium]|nr:long-chain fatty acid--CoA ligase [Verrucomicrobiae bacterium]